MTSDQRQVATPARAFPATFRWGAATSSYQIEGAVDEDGRGESIWDTFCRVPAAVSGGDTGDIACDFYHRFRDDVRLMAELGLNAYRFSVAWPRVQPTGRGKPNEAGLDFYRELVDELLDNGIEPWLSLYHWDLPQELEDRGGWPERDTAARFADYAAVVHDALGDRVRYWSTHNEPWCASFLGYGNGLHAPGRQEPASAVRAAHHLLLSHGLATQAMRASRRDTEIGITLNLFPVTPVTRTPADLDAARRIDGLANRLFLDPLLAGRYPSDVLADVAPVSGTAHIHDGDEARIGVPIDFLGINYYRRYVVAGPPPDSSVAVAGQVSAYPGSEGVRFIDTGAPVTAMGWEIDADGLTELLLRLRREYPAMPLYICENGAAFDDVVGVDGTVDDAERTAYLEAHLRACHDAISVGVPLRGYFVWSLMDNFEWAHGYAKRFGIVRVDYATQQRTVKASGHWYAQVIRRGGLDAE